MRSHAVAGLPVSRRGAASAVSSPAPGVSSRARRIERASDASSPCGLASEHPTLPSAALVRALGAARSLGPLRRRACPKTARGVQRPARRRATEVALARVSPVGRGVFVRPRVSLAGRRTPEAPSAPVVCAADRRLGQGCRAASATGLVLDDFESLCSVNRPRAHPRASAPRLLPTVERPTMERLRPTDHWPFGDEPSGECHRER